MSKLNISKKLLGGKQRVIAGIMAGFILVGSTAAAGFGLLSKKEEKVENQIGYSNVTFNMDPEDFVILSIGDHDDYGSIKFQKSKMEYCNKNDISLGVVISTDSENEADIYNDVEYAKGIVRDYNIDFPVYLNINNIITNDDLNNEMKTKLIRDFCEKCSANNIYVGLYGTDTNLSRVKQYCNINEYDAFVVMDKDEITYDGPYKVYRDMEGKIIAKEDISKIIRNKDLNNSERFASDGSFTISNEEELIDVSLRYGLSVSELLEFNGLKKSNIKGKTTLRIPSSIATAIPTGVVTYKQLDRPIIGCDISYAQADSPDWEQLANNFDFMIIRSNIGLSEDSYFAKNATQANLNNIPIGAYCYNKFDSRDCQSRENFIAQHEHQADYTISVLKNKKIDYPVYLDVEGIVDSTTYEPEDVISMLNIWKTKMEAAGYIPGLYCNQSTFKYLASCVDYDISDELEVWIAGGPQYSTTEQTCSKHEHIAIDKVKIPSVLDNETYGANIAQVTNICTNAGAGDTRGHLDVNFSKVDYSTRTYETEEQKGPKFEIKEFTRIDPAGVASVALAAGGLVGAGMYGFKKLEKSKQKKRIRK